jgi:hypothetical protein
MARLLEDAAAGRYKRAIDPTAAAAATASASGTSTATDAAAADPAADAAAAAQPLDSKQVVASELAKAAAKQARLIEVLQGLQDQVPELHDELGRVLLHARATEAWLQPQAAGEVH